MKVDSDSQDAVVTVELVGGTKGPVTLDEDRNIVLLIKNKDTQSIKVTITHDKESIEKDLWSFWTDLRKRINYREPRIQCAGLLFI